MIIDPEPSTGYITCFSPVGPINSIKKIDPEPSTGYITSFFPALFVYVKTTGSFVPTEISSKNNGVFKRSEVEYIFN